MLSDLKICVSVIGLTLKSFLLQLEKAQNLTDFIELRVDFIQDINPEMLDVIATHTNKKSILCCRAKKDGGKFQGTLEEQNKILQVGNNLGFNYLDIDLYLANKITIQNKKAKFILSYHNFKKTPDFKELKTIAAHMWDFKPDILKFAVMTNSQTDVKTLFQLLLNKKENENMIVLGMGKQGKTTRLLAPLLGGYLTFTSLEEAKSAPGQIAYEAMENFYYRFQEILDH
ncbi:type I 3-dehydroquinate dehydratase [Coxiella-like endosymbiont of Rhipicephalus sanguineus]|uniref:type I 3-dehydroquinate dehydratase n=1 Tax=Coxiella-like endosymbiont of Rhipicephalus sanguineus TaxID=1955402 RepID=UPI00255A91C2|nr:type I 3-dehydroquinate dehydratase [Coxiella-like endosymbiont of Rhipicephalus sanguineus]MBT8506677.1 type I 3-dehydroquinate dehydratase [Coxiella-like endosymbiont of Rhipicephalus sanguineus]